MVADVMQLSLARAEQESIRLRDEISKLKLDKDAPAKASLASRLFGRAPVAKEAPVVDAKPNKAVIRTAVKYKLGLLQGEV